MERGFSKPRKGGTWQAILGVALSAFAFGALVVGYYTWDRDTSFGSADSEETAELESPTLLAETSEATPAPTPTAEQSEEAAEATEAVERVEEQQGGLDQRLAAAEQRLAKLDLQTQAAAGNAARAEGLLIAFATRRTLERGDELGYLADQLRLRFSDALPNAVDKVIESSRDPITLVDLIARLEGLGPKLSESTEEPSFDRLKREIGELFVVRRETAPSPQPQRRLDRARLFLESGRVTAAIKEVQNLPGAANAAKWLADAERYAGTQRALDVIETSAVLEPRRLRDRTGTPIEQSSPAEDSGAN